MRNQGHLCLSGAMSASGRHRAGHAYIFGARASCAPHVGPGGADQTRPKAWIALATFSKPAMFAPAT